MGLNQDLSHAIHEEAQRREAARVRTHGTHQVARWPQFRRWFRFSLRTLFLAMTLVGIFLGWLGVEWKWIESRRAILDGRCRPEHWHGGSYASFIRETGPTTKAPGFLWLFGEKGCARLEVKSGRAFGFSEAEQKRIRELFPEASITALSDDGDKLIDYWKPGEPWKPLPPTTEWSTR